MIELNVKANPRNAKKNADENAYFTEELYIKNRYKVEQSNAWMLLKELSSDRKN